MSTNTTLRADARALTRLSRTSRAELRIAEALSRHSIAILRVTLGLVFLGFGTLKLFPGASPAEALAVRTVDALTFGVITGHTALLMVAVMEIMIGLTLISGLLLRVGLLVMAVSMVGILSPLVLFFGDLFPGGSVTLEAQYVLKDVVLVSAGLVIAARTLGACLTLPSHR